MGVVRLLGFENDRGGNADGAIIQEIAAGNVIVLHPGDGSGFYRNPVAPEDRSLMNVTFVIGDAELEKKFVAEAKAKGLLNLKGHRVAGGMRASIYNAMPIEGVEALIDFMEAFRKENC